MFSIFKKKSEKEKLAEQYRRLLKESHALSTINRRKSDQKAYEADEVMKRLVTLD
ncbi:MAG: Lacal_2735 family protein [Flavobacteriaceae bacterium]